MGRAATRGLSWLVALRLGRVSNLPTVWTNVAAGVVLAGGAAGPVRTGLLLAAITSFYLAGMFLNDAFDRDIDARERPERPIPAGMVSARTVFAAGFAMIGAALALLVVAGYGTAGGTGWRAPAAGLALAAAILLYDRWHKGNPLSPVLMGLCRVLVYVTAALAVTEAPALALWVGAGVLLSYLIGLTFIAKQETLARVDNLWPLGFLAVPLVYGAAFLGAGPALPGLLAGLVLWLLYALWFLVRRRPGDVPRTVAALLAGICLIDALLLASQGATGLAWLAVAGFLLTLVLQRYVPAT